MGPTDRGRHCALCQKEVIDFVEEDTMTVLRELQRNSQLCGRITPAQLKGVNDLIRQSRRRRMSKSTAALFAALAFGGTALQSQSGKQSKW